MIALKADDLPEEITQHLQAFLSQRSGWSEARILQSALSLFLLQNGVNDRAVSQLYLQAMFPDGQVLEGAVEGENK